ncbi:MAG: hypothetical protein HW387_1238 [Parachlamydiales bacterium]|nr:hypothetical protein [Parachlamydiales bacterium]
MEHYHNQLPIRSKIDVAEEIGQIIHCLHTGKRETVDSLIENLKSRSIYLDEKIQGDVLMFAEAIQFQDVYDPWHIITPEIEEAANQLIEDLGFVPPSP